MNNADNDCTMSRESAATRCPVVIEGQAIELEEALQAARNNEAFTQVLVEARSTELPQRLQLQDAIQHGFLVTCCRDLIASRIRLVAGR